MSIPAVILVEVLESGIEMLLPVHPIHVHRCSDELVVVYRSVPVSISLQESRSMRNIVNTCSSLVMSRL